MDIIIEHGIGSNPKKQQQAITRKKTGSIVGFSSWKANKQALEADFYVQFTRPLPINEETFMQGIDYCTLHKHDKRYVQRLFEKDVSTRAHKLIISKQTTGQAVHFLGRLNEHYINTYLQELFPQLQANAYQNGLEHDTIIPDVQRIPLKKLRENGLEIMIAATPQGFQREAFEGKNHMLHETQQYKKDLTHLLNQDQVSEFLDYKINTR